MKTVPACRKTFWRKVHFLHGRFTLPLPYKGCQVITGLRNCILEVSLQRVGLEGTISVCYLDLFKELQVLKTGPLLTRENL